MKKIQSYALGDIRVEEAEIPTPRTGEIAIKNEVTLTCGIDVKTYKCGYRYESPFGMRHEASGVVYAVGEGVTGFIVGDRVVTHNSASCGTCYYRKKGQEFMCVDLIQNQFTNGAYAEYQLVLERIVKLNTFHIPEGTSYKQAASLELLVCALYGAEMTSSDPGDYVCVDGCGLVGPIFVRTCVLRGTHVIACDMIPERLALAKRLGAQKIINIKDLNGKDQAEAMRELTSDARGVDVTIKAAGLPEAWQTVLRMVRSGGGVLFFGGMKKGPEVPADTTLAHYSQLTLKGVFHIIPQHINAAFGMLKMGAISAEGFAQNEYYIGDIEKTTAEHASGKVIRSCIVYK